MTVIHGKDDERRTVSMESAAFAPVGRWLDSRRALGVSSRRSVFWTFRRKPIDPTYVRRLLPRLAARAGIEMAAHAHGLGHGRAAESAPEAVAVNVVQQQLRARGRSRRPTAPYATLPADRVTAMQAWAC